MFNNNPPQLSPTLIMQLIKAGVLSNNDPKVRAMYESMVKSNPALSNDSGYLPLENSQGSIQVTGQGYEDGYVPLENSIGSIGVTGEVESPITSNTNDIGNGFNGKFNDIEGGAYYDFPESNAYSVPEEAPQKNGMGLLALLNSPLFGKGVNLDSSLYTLGRSLGFKNNVNSPTDRQRKGNLWRGIGAGGSSLLKMARQVGSGVGQQNMMNNFFENYHNDNRQNLLKTGMQYYEDGGTHGAESIPVEKGLVNDEISGLPEDLEQEANAELENGEWVKHPNGDIQKVIGRTHEEDGEKFNLEEGTQIISNNLNIGTELSKTLKEKYDLKVKGRHTYASVISKYSSKLGITKLNDEQEGFFNKLQKNSDVKEENTSKINEMFISSKIKEIEEKKKPLLLDRNQFFDYIFQKQEESKNIEKFRKGGVYHSKAFKALCSKHGMTLDQGLKLLGNNGFKKTDGGYILSERQSSSYDDSDKELLISFYSQYLSSEAVKRFSTDLDNGNIEINQDLLADLRESNPMNVGRQGTLEGGRFGDVDTSRVDNFVLNEYHERKYGEPLDITDTEQVHRIQKEYAEAFQSTYGSDYVSSTGENISDGLFGNRTSAYFRNQAYVKGTKAGTLDVDKLIQASRDNPDEVREELKGYGVTLEDLEKYKNSAYKYINIRDFSEIEPLDSEGISTGETINTPQDFEEITDTPQILPYRGERQELRQYGVNPDAISMMGQMMLPDQSMLPPGGVLPHARIDRSLGRINPVKLGIEDVVRQSNRVEDFAVSQLETIPDSQNKSVLAAITANTQTNLNDIITKINTQNAQNQFQADQVNLQQSNMEEQYRGADTLSYEQRALTGLSKTEEDIFRYYDYNRKIDVGEFNTRTRMNTLNSLFENYNIGADGSIQYDARNPRQFAMDRLREVGINRQK